jgi:hypothetical protein
VKKSPKYVKGITIATILLLIGISLFPVTGAISNNQINAHLKLKEKLEQFIRYYSQKKPEPEPVLTGPSSDRWIQVIGDYPNSMMDNGFNNSYNVAVRGKTTFIIDDVEYLFLGTGNVITSPFSPEMIANTFAKYDSIDLSSLKQLVLNLVVRAMDNYFSSIDTQGCELWYFNGLDWEQSVGDDTEEAIIGKGFGNSNNMELTMLVSYKPLEVVDTYLYSGTFNPRDGLEIWRTNDPIDGVWEPLIHSNGEGIFSSGFGNKNNQAAYSAAILNNWLYIGTMNWNEGCEIWRTNGDIWERVIGGGCNINHGFGDDNIGFERDIYAWEMIVFEDIYSKQEHLYVGTFNIAGCELWRTSDGVDWICLVGDNGTFRRGFNMVGVPLRTHNYGIRRLEIFQNSLYIGTASVPPFGIKFNDKNIFVPNIFLESIGSGCGLWRFDGSEFKKIIGRKFSMDLTKHSGFGDWTNAYIWSLREFDGRLFAGTWNPGRFVTDINFQLGQPIVELSLATEESQHTQTAGCEIWYTDDGIDWYQMVGDETHIKSSQWPKNGFGDKNNIGARALIPYNDFLYLGITNTVDGCELWRFDGSGYPSQRSRSMDIG